MNESRREQKEKVARDGVPRVTLSFYRYVRIGDPLTMRNELFERFSEFGCFGRIYVASEGINAQMNVPCARWNMFDRYIQSKNEFRGMEYKKAVEETDQISFHRLSVKVREKIVADGLDDNSFDVTRTGAYLTAEEMNEYIDNPSAVVVDMRNSYESEVGHFENALTPDVDSFREELKVVPELLKGQEEKKVALYCTGGIRCEKASAWLRHNGFKDVKHLKGGIIDYKRQVEALGLPNRFRGKNFVFDERLGERISDEVIAHCHLCHTTKCDTHIHCKNQACHVLFICCTNCLLKKRNYCSYTCMTFDRLPQKVKKLLSRRNHQKKLEQFKKHRLKSIVR